MAKIIDEIYDGKVIQTFSSNGVTLVFDNSGLVYSENYGNVTLNKLTIKEINGENQTLVELNKPYLVFYFNNIGFSFTKFYYYVGNNGKVVETTFSFDDIKTSTRMHEVLPREEIEKVFEDENYDALYVVDTTLGLVHMYEKEKGLIKGEKIIPTDEEIIQRDYDDRFFTANLAYTFRGEDINECNENPVRERSIDEIECVDVLCGIFCHFADVLLTVKEGKLEANWISIRYLKDGKFIIDKDKIDVEKPSESQKRSYFEEEIMRNAQETARIEREKYLSKLEETTKEKPNKLRKIFKRRNK